MKSTMMKQEKPDTPSYPFLGKVINDCLPVGYTSVVVLFESAKRGTVVRSIRMPLIGDAVHRHRPWFDLGARSDTWYMRSFKALSLDTVISLSND